MNCIGIALGIALMHCSASTKPVIDTWCHTVAPQIRAIDQMPADEKKALPIDQKRINVALKLKYKRCQ